MEQYWISFTIADKTIGGRSYNDRYEDLVNDIRAFSINYWLDTTSFLIFETDLSLTAVGKRCKKAIAPSEDLIVIRELNKRSAVYAGKLDDDDLKVFLPYIKKL